MKNIKLFLLSGSIIFSFQAFSMEINNKNLNEVLLKFYKQRVNSAFDFIQSKEKVQEFFKNISGCQYWKNLLKNDTLHPMKSNLIKMANFQIHNHEKLNKIIEFNHKNSIKTSNRTARRREFLESMSSRREFLESMSSQREYMNRGLQKSIEYEDIKIVEYFIKMGADVRVLKKYLSNLSNDYQKNKANILRLANIFGKLNLLKFLKDLNGNTLLHHAISNNDKVMTVILLGYCPKLATIKNNNKSTPVELAVGLGKHKILKYLMNQAFSE